MNSIDKLHSKLSQKQAMSFFFFLLLNNKPCIKNLDCFKYGIIQHTIKIFFFLIRIARICFFKKLLVDNLSFDMKSLFKLLCNQLILTILRTYM